MSVLKRIASHKKTDEYKAIIEKRERLRIKSENERAELEARGFESLSKEKITERLNEYDDLMP